MEEHMNRKGFTLIEMLIVVGIIGILAAIAIPAYIGQQRKAARTEASTNLQNLRLLMEQNFAEQGSYTPPNNGGTAPVSTLTYYATSAVTNNGLEDFVRRFSPAGLDNPGQLDSLSYTYTLTFAATTFTATAAAKPGRRVAGDAVCTIDQNNTRIGPCW